MTHGVPLASLVPGASGVVTGVCLDSRRVRPGDLYVGLPGARTHGARFAADAARAGAIVLLTDAAGAALAADSGLPVAVVADPRTAMAPLAAAVHGHPADHLEAFAVTGTNGKTSTVFLLEAALAALRRRVATIGTIGFRVDGRFLEAPRTTITTPESPDLQALLARMVAAGSDTLAMEVSSHALDLARVDAVGFTAAGFTMLGQDHLEYHHTMDAYFAAKAKLFTEGRTRHAVVNTADPWGARLAAAVRDDGRATLTTTQASGADYRAETASPRPDGGWEVRLAHPGGTTRFGLSMLGVFNVANAVTALAMVGAAGLDVDAAAAGLAAAHVPGRMQRVDLGPGRPHVVVDFAHTPQAVASALGALPRTGRRIAVLGAGGDRDPSKRGPMGEAAAAASDLVIVTDDNPRSEEPAAIRAAVLAGARGHGAEVIDGGDRRSAIALALRTAVAGDWVAVLGKGHETGQDIGGVVSPFDDVAVVRELGEE
ncbi:UDP-N-acetylmuramoyl-L-alanyl-D-glutamate--2,6-diaminopimelate ligase [Propioniciclava sp.]|uniref:UDP-N-acetylmuramoyl-L-alanyl-D-glutamate--2, 6-diaminopimelate ligase n=1 Tax=Propioniciclava sp. TaxID=2038686 RepID=UPI00260F456D|nr:UDP-N-acetylmuramoyl-L-alanyl-D-glutamate--2,6-diaminopimelate ligase [Propioniciclava sp.]